MTARLSNILERYRRPRRLKFIITTVYPVDATNSNETKALNRVKFNDAVLDLAYKADDVVALDLMILFLELTEHMQLKVTLQLRGSLIQQHLV